jgi:cytochrome P450
MFAQDGMLDAISKLRPPAPAPQASSLGPVALLRVLASNPLEAWTEAHFSEPVVLGGLPFTRVAVVSEPAAIRRVLLYNTENYQKDWLQRRVLSAGLTDGLLTAERRQWRTQRRALAPLFARRSVMHYAAPMIDAARAAVVRLKPRQGQTVDMAVEVTRVTLDVLERTIFSDGFGTDPEEIRRGMKTYFETVGRLDRLDVLGVAKMLPRFVRSKAQAELRFFERAVDGIIATRREQIGKTGYRASDDLLTHLLQASDPQTGETLSESEVCANVLTFIAAGHETTANCVTWSLFLLSQSPEWRARVTAEADRELDGEPQTLADRLVETRAAIDESNRLYPPIAAISRSALGPDALAGQPIQKGTMVVIAPYVLHRHRALWPEPDRFEPARFLPDAPDKIDRFAYLPFGVEPRTCVGATFALQEAAIVLATLMRHFRFTPAPDHRVWPVQKMTLRPEGGLPMLVEAG